jgi:chromate transporter
MIASAGVSIVLLAFFTDGILSFAAQNINYISMAIFAVGLFILRNQKVNPLYVMGGAGVIGLVAYAIIGV